MHLTLSVTLDLAIDSMIHSWGLKCLCGVLDLLIRFFCLVIYSASVNETDIEPFNEETIAKYRHEKVRSKKMFVKAIEEAKGILEGKTCQFTLFTHYNKF
jgi:hypothetical protein